MMKNKIYGRKVGSGDEMAVLIESDGASNTSKMADPAVLVEFVVANARRAVQALRQANVEGYVLFEGDPMRYEFTPDADFAYPSSVH